MGVFPEEVMAVPVQKTRNGGRLEARAEWNGDPYLATGTASGRESTMFEILEHRVRVELTRDMGFPVMQVDESGKHQRVRKRPDGTYETLT